METIIRCQSCQSFLYLSDSIKKDESLICPFCYSDDIMAYRKKQLWYNFFIWLGPTLFTLIAFLIIFILEKILHISETEAGTIITGILILVLIVFVLGVSFYIYSNLGLHSMIGYPERQYYYLTMHSSNTASIEVTTMYSGSQVLKMLLNVVKYLFILSVLIFAGWAIFLIHLILYFKYKKKYKDFNPNDVNTIATLQFLRTEFGECELYLSELPNSEIFIYDAIIPYNNTIYVVCLTLNNEEFILKILPGFKLAMENDTKICQHIYNEYEILLSQNQG